MTNWSFLIPSLLVSLLFTQCSVQNTERDTHAMCVHSGACPK